uniref:Protein kinase domain-containing protein n=1 Tax=Arcella intermedia TaxID=1963864 RepID=A0A6B2LDW2_9EUKA
MHRSGVIHRGGKPEDIVITSTGHVKLIDFNLSKVGSEGKTFCGTPEYLAPEVLMGCPYSNAVDMYTLGTLTYELTAGIPPFYDENVQAMYGKIMSSPLQMSGGLFSGDLGDFVGGLLQRDPLMRPDVAALKKHRWLADVDWDGLGKVRKELLVPKLEGLEDLSCFDSAFTSMSVEEVWQDSVVPTEDTFGDWYYDRHLSERALEKFPGNFLDWPPYIKGIIKELCFLASVDSVWSQVPLELLLLIAQYFLSLEINQHRCCPILSPPQPS